MGSLIFRNILIAFSSAIYQRVIVNGQNIDSFRIAESNGTLRNIDPALIYQIILCYEFVTLLKLCSVIFVVDMQSSAVPRITYRRICFLISYKTVVMIICSII